MTPSVVPRAGADRVSAYTLLATFAAVLIFERADVR
jgi:hypothetical protein